MSVLFTGEYHSTECRERRIKLCVYIAFKHFGMGRKMGKN
jgi:hypothetical protein